MCFHVHNVSRCGGRVSPLKFAMALLRLVAALTLASSVAASLLLPGHERSRPLQPQHASRQQLPRRSLFGLGTAAAVAAAFPVRVQPAAAAGNALPLPPAAVVLQIADNTIAMQGMMIQSVKDMDDLTEQQRKDVGRWPPIGRGELKQSVDVLLKNSKLTTYPKGDDAAGVFYGVKFILGSGDSPLTRDDYILVANQYGKGRDACRAVFESFTEAQP